MTLVRWTNTQELEKAVVSVFPGPKKKTTCRQLGPVDTLGVNNYKRIEIIHYAAVKYGKTF